MTKNFLALDLEMNQPSKTIIQVGICIGNREKVVPDCITMNYYVKTDEIISDYITNLTGITNEHIDKYGESLAEIAYKISNLITIYKCFTNPVTWGGGDFCSIKEAFDKAGIEFNHFGRRWIDVKTIYTFLQMANNKTYSGGLSKCMKTYGLNFEGQKHQASTDALNTLRFFFHLMNIIKAE